MSDDEQGASDAIYREHLKAADERAELEQLRTERAAAAEFTEQLIANLGSWDVLPGGTYEPEFRRRMLEADGWTEQQIEWLVKIARREVER